MSRANVERLQALYAELARGNFRGSGDLLAADVVYEPFSDGRRAYRGPEAVANYMREFLAQWSDFRIEAREFAEIGEAVLVTERQRGSGKSSGVETEMTFYATWIFRGGQVVRVRWDSDRDSAFAVAKELQVRRPQVSE